MKKKKEKLNKNKSMMLENTKKIPKPKYRSIERKMQNEISMPELERKKEVLS